MREILALFFLAAVSAASLKSSPVIEHNDGHSRVGRIYGGQEAEYGQFPHQVKLFYIVSFACGGSLLSERWFVTAAHCVAGRTLEYFAMVTGAIKLEFEGASYKLDQIIYHENYTGGFRFDVAVAQTAEKIVLGDNVQPIKLARSLNFGETLTLSGFGRTRNEGYFALKLQYLESVLLSPEECGSRSGITHDGVICFFREEGRGTCFGDSGGPATRYVDGEAYLVGISNFIVGGCANGNPDGYASVPFFYDWIVKNAQDEEA